MKARQTGAIALTVPLGLALCWAATRSSPVALTGIAAVAIAVIVSLGYLAIQVNPAYLFSAAVVLSPMASNWEAVGIPGALSLDRLVLLAAIAVVLLRQVLSTGGPWRLRLEPVHWVLAAAMVYATASALAAGTLTSKEAFFRLFQIYGLLPFLVFLTAPLVFRDSGDRNILLVALIGLGAYLGLTALFESIGLNALVFPKYINDPHYGLQFGRARGPFADAVTNGMGLYACAVASAIGAVLWRRPSHRVIAGIVGILCLVGTLLTLQRSVWLATILATIVVLVTIRDLRRILAPALAVGLLATMGALVLVPGLADKGSHRVSDQRPLWDRANAAHAALNVIDRRPLVGLGWGEFTRKGSDYFQLAGNYPLTRAEIHNLFLGIAAELGLIGLALWMLGFLMGVGTAMVTRPPPELRIWRAGLVAVGVFFITLVNFVPPVVFPNLIIWLWAGVVWTGRTQLQQQPVARAAKPRHLSGVAQAST